MWKLSAEHFGRRAPKDLTVPWVDQLRPGADQRLAGMDQCQVSLRRLSPMLYRVEELGIYPGQARKLLGIELVGLMLVTID